jgi:hypothetical protein
MFGIDWNYRITMLYNDGYTKVEDKSFSLSMIEYIGEKYQKNDREDYKRYWIYIDIIIKVFGIKVIKRTILLKEWGQYDEV